MKTLFSRILKGGKKAKVFAISLLAITTITGATVLAGYGPNGAPRTIFDFSNPAQREGAFDAPRFNSYINTNVYGDERAFLDSKECVAAGDACFTQGQNGGYTDQTNVQPGKEYIIRAYVHNDANPSINCLPEHRNAQGGCDVVDNNAPGVAHNTRIRFEMPTGVANGFTLQARISADNAIPQTVYDTTDLKNDATPFGVQFETGSARIYNAAHPGGLALSDDIMGANGTLIGHDQMNGIYPGCFEFSSFVVIRVKVTNQTATFQKQVRKEGTTEWGKTANVKPGDKVQWMLTFQNKGQTNFDHVILSDALPPHLTLVPDSVRFVDAVGDVKQPNYQPFFTTAGIDFGTWKPNGGFHVRFDTIAKDDFDTCEVNMRNVGFEKTTQTPNEEQSTADVRITKENCKPTTPITPASTPTTLVNTGPGDIIGIFAATTIAGAVAHRLLWGRRAKRI